MPLLRALKQTHYQEYDKRMDTLGLVSEEHLNSFLHLLTSFVTQYLLVQISVLITRDIKLNHINHIWFLPSCTTEASKYTTMIKCNLIAIGTQMRFYYLSRGKKTEGR